MKKEKNVYLIYLSLIFLLVALMALFFPIVGPDISWKLLPLDDLKNLFEIRNEGIITSFILAVFAKYNILRVIGTGFLVTTLLGLVKNTVNPKNISLVLLSGCLFLLLDRIFFASSIATFNGFTKYFISSLMLLIYMFIIIKKAIPKMNKLMLFFLGLVLTSLNLAVAFIVLIVTIVYAIYTKKEREEIGNIFVLLVGAVFGALYTFSKYDLSLVGWSERILHSFIPALSNANFLIVIIFSGLIMLQVPKMYASSGDKIALASLGGMAFYLFSSLLIQNNYVNYIAYIGYFVSTFYVLYNFTNSRLIKRKVFIIYAFKLAFIIFTTLLGPIEIGSTLFIYILDIIVIAMCYDYIWPTRFLEPLWGITLFVFLLSNIYIYRIVFYKNRDMNIYIKNRLECYQAEVQVPTLYQNDYLYKNIPRTPKEIEEFLDYHNIDVYRKDDPVEIYYKE